MKSLSDFLSHLLVNLKSIISSSGVGVAPIGISLGTFALLNKNVRFKLKKLFNPKYWLKKFLTRLIWLFGCLACVLLINPPVKAFAYDTQPMETVPFMSEYSSSMGSYGAGGASIGADYKTYFSPFNYNGFFNYYVNDSVGFVYPFNYSSYDYYIAYSVWSTEGSTGKISCYPVNLSVNAYQEGTLVGSYCENFTFLHLDGTGMQGFTAIGKIPSSFNSSSIRALRCDMSSGGVSSSGIYMRAFIYQVDKGENYTLADVVNAINNQTITLNGSIQHGNESTSDIVSAGESEQSEFETAGDSLKDSMQDVITFEDSMKNQLSDYNSQVVDTFSDYSITGNLLNCSNWVADRMTDVFNRSSDFKILYMFPMILGLCLMLVL